MQTGMLRDDPTVVARRPDPRDGGAADSVRTVVRPAPARARSGWLGPGTVLNNTHRIDALIATGGMGHVYRATNLANGATVAVKTMRADCAGDPAIVELFRREGAALRRLHDPAIVYYEGSFLGADGLLYLVMEYVDGPSLAEAARGRPLAPAALLRLRDRLAAGLAAAHAAGVVHRDLSPDNVLLPGGRLEDARLIDFGIAKVQAGGTVIGSGFAGKLDYAAPEQLGLFGGRVDARADIYGLGLVLAYAATGAPLFRAASLAQAVDARRRPPDLSQVPAALRPALAAMLAPDPADRPVAMAALIAPAAPVAPAAAPPARAGGWRRRAGALGAAALLAAGLAWMHGTAPPPAPADLPGEEVAAIPPPPAAAPFARLDATVRTPPGTVLRDCAGCPPLVVVPGGSFAMGTPAQEPGRGPGEGPQARIAVRTFALAATPVTFAEWDACVAGGGCPHQPGDEGWGRDTRPVVNVSWEDARSYLAWLSRRSGLRYRLPSEAEWEYAARAGAATPYWWGDAVGTDNANCRGCTGDVQLEQTVPVASFRASPFGLHDMAGNVWQWVEDCGDVPLDAMPRDGQAAVPRLGLGGPCVDRAIRGGSWDSPPAAVRAGARRAEGSAVRQSIIGFRVARSLPD